MPAIDYFTPQPEILEILGFSALQTYEDNQRIRVPTCGQKTALTIMLGGQSCLNFGGAETGKSLLVDVQSGISGIDIMKYALLASPQ